jgi:hypothetical protein
LSDTALTLGLYVTHGIFSKGFAELGKRFDRIYAANTLGIEYPDSAIHTLEYWPTIRQHLNAGALS